MLKELLVAFSLVAVCLLLHVTTIVFFADWMLDQHEKRKEQMGMVGYMLLLIAAFTVIISLHLIEMVIWAALYFTNSLFPNFETSLYFSVTSYTTIGFGDVLLPPAWRMLGGIEAVTGVLLCGLSTAFVFAIVNGMIQIRVQRRTNSE
jgi:hypothetical protein